MRKKKYVKEYHETTNRKDFIILAMRRYKDITRSTARRRFYDMKAIFGFQVYKYEAEHKQKPQILKLRQFNEFKNYKMTITKKFLRRYGYNEFEINWLEDERMFDGRE